AFLSANPHFCKSALPRYTQHDFIALVEKHRIAWHEKTLGQLFCDGSARQIVAMLLAECEGAGVDVRVGHRISGIEKADPFGVSTVTAPSRRPLWFLPPAGFRFPRWAPPASLTTPCAALAWRWSTRGPGWCRSPSPYRR